MKQNIIFNVILFVILPSKQTEQIGNELTDQVDNKMNVFKPNPKQHGKRVFTNTLPGPPDCGRRQTGRIGNGSQVVPYGYPWQVAIFHDCRFLCSGTIVSQQFILSAASCFLDESRHVIDTSSLSILVGAYNLKAYRNWKDLIPKRYAVAQVYINDNYSSTTGQNDAALLQTKSLINLNPFVQMVCLDNTDDPIDYREGDDVIVTGWGSQSESGMSASLQQATFNIQSYRLCQSNYQDGLVTSCNVCAVGDGKVTCQRDMGGPLHYQRDSTFTELAIIPLRDGCTPTGMPEVFTRIRCVYDWIVRILANHGHPV